MLDGWSMYQFIVDSRLLWSRLCTTRQGVDSTSVALLQERGTWRLSDAVRRRSEREHIVRRIAIIYFSATGTTAALADAINAGAAESATVVVYCIAAADIVGGRFQNEEVLKLADTADGLAFGSPTYMGGPAAQFKAFADATSDRWGKQRWANKVATGFTTGSCANGDQGHTLAYFTILAAQHGMLWCSLGIPGGYDPFGRNRLGSHLGLATHAVDGALDTADLATAHHLGRRLARAASEVASPLARDPRL